MEDFKNINSNHTYKESGGGSRRSNSRSAGSSSKSSEVDVVNLPQNLYTPNGARAFDFRKLVIAPANSGKTLLFEFTVPKGMFFVWQQYSLFNDALTTEFSFFDVTVNNNKVLKYHGDPSDNFKLSLGATPDLGNQGFIEANVRLLPFQTIRWFVINNDDVDVTMGVRMKGFIDNSLKIGASKFGG